MVWLSALTHLPLVTNESSHSRWTVIPVDYDRWGTDGDWGGWGLGHADYPVASAGESVALESQLLIMDDRAWSPHGLVTVTCQALRPHRELFNNNNNR